MVWLNLYTPTSVLADILKILDVVKRRAVSRDISFVQVADQSVDALGVSYLIGMLVWLLL